MEEPAENPALHGAAGADAALPAPPLLRQHAIELRANRRYALLGGDANLLDFPIGVARERLPLPREGRSMPRLHLALELLLQLGAKMSSR